MGERERCMGRGDLWGGGMVSAKERKKRLYVHKFEKGREKTDFPEGMCILIFHFHSRCHNFVYFHMYFPYVDLADFPSGGE